jgi:hypothetical protein
MKEDLKRRLSNRINEGYRKEENIKTTFHGTKPSTEKGLFKRINDLTKNGQLNTRVFGGLSDAFEFYQKILGAVGNLHCLGKKDSNVMVQLDTNNNMSYFGIMRAKEVGEGQYKASITFSPHSDETQQPEPEMNEPTIDDGNSYEIYGEDTAYRMTGDEFRSLVKESVMKILEKSDIHIKKSKEGTFTAAANKHGESVQGFASKVLNNKENYSPAMVKKANFARNASKWNK